VEPEDFSRGDARRRWAELIRLVYEMDPLARPRCGGEMRVIALIQAPAVIDKIPRHLREKGRDARAGSAGPAGWRNRHRRRYVLSTRSSAPVNDDRVDTTATPATGASTPGLRVALARLERGWELEQGRHVGPSRRGWMSPSPAVGVLLLVVSLYAGYVAVAMVPVYLGSRPLLVLAAGAMAVGGLAGSWMHLAGAWRLRVARHRYEAERATLLARLATAEGAPPPEDGAS